jgi:2-polyprenyl-3-methyl-5-hydroxy-6-metoxy-1,4-benzoquinol methylase
VSNAIATKAPEIAPGGLTANDVILAYRLLFDREPESNEIVARHVAAHGTFKKFRTAMINSPEFRTKLPATLKPFNWPSIRVDVDVSAAQLAEMVRVVEGNWEVLGKSEPHWSVLTNEQFKAANIQETRDAFYRSGKGSAETMAAAIERCGVDVSTLATCLELGCGVGRVTLSLAQQFRSVVAVDISRPHLALAEAAAQERALSNIDFVHGGSLQSLRELPRVDCVYSVIVLQHNPPPVIHAILDILLEKLNPGGVAFFQVPTYFQGYEFNAELYLKNAVVRGRMEMHVLPQPVLFALFAKHGCLSLEVREDGWTGSPRMISNTFLIQKQG